MYICENCGESHTGEYGDLLKYKPKNGASKYRFCCKKCSKAYSTTKNRLEINLKVSNTMRAKNAGVEKKKRIYKKRIRVPKIPDNLSASKIRSKQCVFCNSLFYTYSNEKRCCSVECSIKEKFAKKMLDIELAGYHINYRCVKEYLIYKHGEVCSICGFSGLWNGKEIHMIADHINGRSSDNRIDNMRLVCPMCDTQLPTFKSKNKNSDRKNRKVDKT